MQKHLSHPVKARLAGAAGVLALVASGAIAAYSLATRSAVTEGVGPSDVGGELAEPIGPTPAAPPAVHDSRAALETEMARTWPELGEAVRAVEAGNWALLDSLLSYEEFPCVPDGQEGVAPGCAELGIPEGSVVAMFHYYLTLSSYFTRERALDNIVGMLSRRGAQLGLVADLPDGRALVVFTIDDDGSGLRGVQFYADRSDPRRPLVSYTERFVAASPLDELRQGAYLDQNPRALRYVSPAMEAWEGEKHKQHRNPEPGPGVTPSP